MRATLKRAANRVSIFAQRLLGTRRQAVANVHNNFHGEKPSALSKVGRRLFKWLVVHPPLDPKAAEFDLFGEPGAKLQSVILPSKKAELIWQRKEMIKRLDKYR